jgi:hypothetical protein
MADTAHADLAGNDARRDYLVLTAGARRVAAGTAI